MKTILATGVFAACCAALGLFWIATGWPASPARYRLGVHRLRRVVGGADDFAGRLLLWRPATAF